MGGDDGLPAGLDRILGRAREPGELAELVVEALAARVPGVKWGAVYVREGGMYRLLGPWDIPAPVPRALSPEVLAAASRPHVLRGSPELAAFGEAALLVPVADNVGYVVCACSPRAPAPDEAAVATVASAAARALRRALSTRGEEGLLREIFERHPDAVFIVSRGGRIRDANPAAAAQTGYSREELIGMSILDLAVDEPRVPVEEVISRLHRGESVRLRGRKRRKDGSVYWAECTAQRFVYRGEPLALLVCRDIDHWAAVERALSQREAELGALDRAVRTVASALRLEDVVRGGLEVIRDVTGADYASLVLVNRKGDVERWFVSPRASPEMAFAPRKRGFIRLVTDGATPLVVDDIGDDGSTVPPVTADDGTVIPANPGLVRVGIRSMASVPVVEGGVVRGVLSAYSRAPRAFAERTRLLEALAGVAAVALGNARLYSEARLLFDESPVSLWVEDFSAIVERLNALRERGVTDLRAYLREHPEFVLECVKLLRVHEVNRATLRLYRVRDFRELSEKLPEVIPREVEPLLAEELLAIWERKREFEGIGINRTAAGETIHVRLRWRVFPGHEDDYARVLVSIVDVTDQVRAEEGLKTQLEKLAGLHRTVLALQRCRTVEEVCRAAVMGAREIFDLPICGIGLVEGDEIVPVATVGEVRPRRFRRGEGIAWRTIQEGRTFWGSAGELAAARPVDERIKSAMSVPIGDFGVFQAISFVPDAFTADDVRLVEILAEHLREQISRVRLEEELRERAIRDPLTGLYNRGHLTEVLEEWIARAREEGEPFVVLAADLDNFKRVNDLYGHLEGDRVLREIAGVLRDTAGPHGMVFRYGGDEFVILFPGGEGEGEELARRVRGAVRAWVAEHGFADLGLGISLGSAVWEPPIFHPDELLQRADRDLYWGRRGPTSP